MGGRYRQSIREISRSSAELQTTCSGANVSMSCRNTHNDHTHVIMATAMVLGALALGSVGTATGGWNNPYPRAQRYANIMYSSFSEQPKHLDPVRAYSANEYTFLAQIYEPPLQYHYLKRPYELVTLTAEALPSVTYRDSDGRILSNDTAPESVAFSEYEIVIRPGIRYQPHPALARNAKGAFLYHDLEEGDLASVYTLSDFQHTDTRELVAQDYAYQIKRLAHPRLHSPIYGVMREHIVGLAELRGRIAAAIQAGEEPNGYVDLRQVELEGVEVLDRYRFRIRLHGVYPQFIFWLAMPFFAPMPWEAERFYTQPGMAARNLTLHWYPIGTGAFMLTENNPNLRMVLVRNPNYHGERYPNTGDPSDDNAGLLRDAGRELPFIDKAVYNLEKETIPYWNKFLQGYYDSSGISSESFDQAISFSAAGEALLTDEMRERGIRLTTAVQTSVYYLGFNMLDPVVGGSSERARRLRQAISIAVDFEEFISIFLNGRGVAAQGPIPPGIFGHREGEAGVNPVVYEWLRDRSRRRPLSEAHALLAEAGYAGGIDQETGRPLVIHFDTTATGPDDKARLNWMRKQFRKLNIDLVIRATDYNRFQDKMLKGAAQVYMWGWNADYPDPENFLFLLYGPNAKVGANGENASNYQNPEFDRLFDRMKDMPNGQRRQEAIDRMVAMVRRDAPWSWGFHAKAFSLHHAWLHNVKPNLMANNTLKYWRIDPVIRAQSRDAWNEPVIWPIGLMVTLLIVTVVPAWKIYRRRERSTAL